MKTQNYPIRGLTKILQLFAIVSTLLCSAYFETSGQSRRETIENLRTSLDSVKNILKLHQDKFEEQQKQQSSELLKELSKVQSDVIKLQTQGQNLEKESVESKKQIQALQEEVETLKRTNEELSAEIKRNEEYFPENQFPQLRAKLSPASGPGTNEEIAKIKKWFEDKIRQNTLDEMFTPRCKAFLADILELHTSQTDNLKEVGFEAKWGDLYDTRLTNFKNPFTPDTVTAEKIELEKFEYLGKINSGMFFETITSNTGADAGGKVKRVIKVIRSNGKYLVDNIVSQ